MSDLPRRATAEAVGTAMLLAAVVGSGIMGERLSGGNVAIALLANTVATGAALVALILPDLRPRLGRALQPRRHVGRRLTRRPAVGRGSRLSHRPGRRRVSRRGRRRLDVRAAGLLRL